MLSQLAQLLNTFFFLFQPLTEEECASEKSYIHIFDTKRASKLQFHCYVFVQELSLNTTIAKAFSGDSDIFPFAFAQIKTASLSKYIRTKL